MDLSQTQQSFTKASQWIAEALVQDVHFKNESFIEADHGFFERTEVWGNGTLPAVEQKIMLDFVFTHPWENKFFIVYDHITVTHSPLNLLCKALTASGRMDLLRQGLDEHGSSLDAQAWSNVLAHLSDHIDSPTDGSWIRPAISYGLDQVDPIALAEIWWKVGFDNPEILRRYSEKIFEKSSYSGGQDNPTAADILVYEYRFCLSEFWRQTNSFDFCYFVGGYGSQPWFADILDMVAKDLMRQESLVPFQDLDFQKSLSGLMRKVNHKVTQDVLARDYQKEREPYDHRPVDKFTPFEALEHIMDFLPDAAQSILAYHPEAVTKPPRSKVMRALAQRKMLGGELKNISLSPSTIKKM